MKSATYASKTSSNDLFPRIYEMVRLVPRGRVTTYGHIARCLGSRSGARLVGWAMNSSHRVDPSIPAHRVVNRNGMLTGRMHFDSPDQMKELLEAEGIRISENKVLEFEKVLWDPMELAEWPDFPGNNS